MGPSEQSGWGGLATAESDRTIRVAVSRLDDLLPTDFTASVLKIDTEGADCLVLAGAQRLLGRRAFAHVFCEVNPERMKVLGIPPGEAERCLQAAGAPFGRCARHTLRDQTSGAGFTSFFLRPRLARCSERMLKLSRSGLAKP